MRMFFRTVLACLVLLTLAMFPQGADGLLALNQGDYQDAREKLAATLQSAENISLENVVGYAETFLATGEYDSGRKAVKNLRGKFPGNPHLHYAEALLLKATGQYAAAKELLNSCIAQSPTYYPAHLLHGELLLLTGDRDAAASAFQKITTAANIANDNNALRLVLARALTYSGDFHKANAIHQSLYRSAPKDVENLYCWGELFSDKYNTAEAGQTFEEALAINPNSAKLYAAAAKNAGGLISKVDLAKKALAINPKNIPAMNVLAEVHILDSKYEKALEVTEEALAINPKDEQALGHRASVYHLKNDQEQVNEIADQFQAINPQGSRFFVTLAENCVNRFRYKDAVAFCKQAVAANNRDWQAFALLGANLLRTGDVAGARENLEIAFKGDSFNLFARNALELLDEYEKFAILESEHFQLVIHHSESAVLGANILAVAEDCWQALSKRYNYRPAGKMRIEAYNDHDDFAVRVSGLPGVGLLGVCFGDVLALDTPKAQAGQPYNWAQTLWHEIAHVMALGVSDHRVPRWFTEGLSVYEEMRAHPRWRRKMKLQLYAAQERGMLPALSNINEGFTRPTFPEQVGLTYYQSSRWIEFIVNRYGFSAISGLLEAFKDRQSDEAAIQAVLGVDIETLNSQLFTDLRNEMAQHAAVMENLPPQFSFENKMGAAPAPAGIGNPFFEKIRDGYRLLDEKKYNAAESAFRDAVDIFPDYDSDASPYLGLAAVYRETGKNESLIAALQTYLAVTEYGGAEARELAALMQQNNAAAAAVKYYQQSLETEPYEISARQALAELYRENGSYQAEITERNAIVALNPVDKSAAYYELAQSHFAADNKKEARDNVLRALDLAPGFRDAQRLLLRCVD